MRDKERLEQLENGSSFSSDDITFLLKQARLYQISRDDTRKACHKVREENKELKQENKRYRDAIKETLESFGLIERQKYGKILEKALAGESSDNRT